MLRRRRGARVPARPTTPTWSTCGSTAPRTRSAHVVNRGGYVRARGRRQRLDGPAAGRLRRRPQLALDGGSRSPSRPLADTTDVWSVPGPLRRTRSATGGVDRASLRAARARTSSRASTAAGSRTSCTARPGGRRSASCTAAPSRSTAASLNPVVAVPRARAASPWPRPNVRGSTGYGRDFHHLDDVELRLDSVRDLARARRARSAPAPARPSPSWAAATAAT